MIYLDSLVCPCCTAAVLQTLAENGTGWLNPKLFLEVGKGALFTSINRSSSKALKISYNRRDAG
ncbi:MAG: hypothetical protein N5P05_001008 [Chroococcopsis gigantea SAG 12.99]|jgi:hypothetical protein|nr:hypothetical protein [Chlorogloea purpurea SAG 13.99]MDV2999402.1 hypothetical protein [Chroococcopsis gigantea SAG 12.99]